MRFAKHNKNKTKIFILELSIKFKKYYFVNEINLFNLKKNTNTSPYENISYMKVFTFF